MREKFFELSKEEQVLFIHENPHGFKEKLDSEYNMRRLSIALNHGSSVFELAKPSNRTNVSDVTAEAAIKLSELDKPISVYDEPRNELDVWYQAFIRYECVIELFCGDTKKLLLERLSGTPNKELAVMLNISASGVTKKIHHITEVELPEKISNYLLYEEEQRKQLGL